MSRYETLLFLHLLAAFALVTALVLFVALLVAARRGDGGGAAIPLLRLSGLGSLLWNVGGLGVLVFGVWMAIDLDAYEILDGWVIAALVLWFVVAGAGGRVTGEYRTALGESPESALAVARAPRALILHAVMTLATLALLVDMIFKPGA